MTRAIASSRPADSVVAAELAQITPRVRQLLNRSARDILAVGVDLLRAKELIPHGQFGLWLESEFALSHRSANQFMSAARRFAEVEAAANLPAGVLLELASPGVPGELVDAVLNGEVAATAGAVRDAKRSRMRRQALGRTTRELGNLLFDLPDDSEAAARWIAWQISDEDDDFVRWVSSTLARAAELLASGLAEAG
ncbi:MAG: DUF3102 domain-containing protein [Actinomycetota bacterium]